MPPARRQQERGRRHRHHRPLAPPLLALVTATALLATTAAGASVAAANANATAAAANASASASPLLPPVGAEAPGVVFGTVQVVAVHGPMIPGTTVEHQHQLFVRVRGSGEMRRLLFPSPAPARAPPTGSLVMIRTAPAGACLRPGAPPVDGNPVCVKSMMAHEGESCFLGGGTGFVCFARAPGPLVALFFFPARSAAAFLSLARRPAPPHPPSIESARPLSSSSHAITLHTQ